MSGLQRGLSDPTCGGLLPLITERESTGAIRDAATPQWLSRVELREQALSLAATLSSGDRALAFVIGDNRIATVVAILAARAAGHAVALIAPDLAAVRLQRLIAGYQPEFILSSSPWLDDGSAGRYGPSIASSGSWFDPPYVAKRLDAPAGGINADLAVMLSTSGTTGSAKFVRLSTAAITANAAQIVKALMIRSNDIAIAHLPVSYSYGLSVITSHLRVGAAVYLTGESIVRPEFWAAIRAVGGTHFPGVPFHYNFLARSDLAKQVPGTVRTLTQAGGALERRIQDRIHDFAQQRGAQFFVMYGQTEAGPRMTTLPDHCFAEKRGSVGHALDGATIRIEDVDHNAVPAGVEGAVVFDGPNVMMGYAEQRSDLVKGDENGGRLETGDLGRIDGDGFLTITGRIKRVAKLAGLRISLDEVEARLRETATAAVLDHGEKIVVFCEDPVLIKGSVVALSGEWRVPGSSFVIRGIEHLPVRDSGKIDYEQLRGLI
ncbi:MAG: AMP-binding protein [Azospirillaceae bacterium]|nr:AMP-binding protein [Azospirillaceae bacterium]